MGGAKHRLRFSHQSTEDLLQIADHLGHVAGPDIADRVESNIRRTFDLIAHFPEQGRLLSNERRMRPCTGNARSYLIYWQIGDDRLVRVLRVLHAARQSQRSPLEGDGDSI